MCARTGLWEPRVVTPEATWPAFFEESPKSHRWQAQGDTAVASSLQKKYWLNLIEYNQLKHAQDMAGHADPRTTRLYGHSGDQVSVDEVERIHI